MTKEIIDLLIRTKETLKKNGYDKQIPKFQLEEKLNLIEMEVWHMLASDYMTKLELNEYGQVIKSSFVIGKSENDDLNEFNIPNIEYVDKTREYYMSNNIIYLVNHEKELQTISVPVRDLIDRLCTYDGLKVKIGNTKSGTLDRLYVEISPEKLEEYIINADSAKKSLK